jgi:hypothetical protein
MHQDTHFHPQEGGPMRRYVFKLTFLALAALGSSVVLGQDQPNDQQIANTILQKLKAEKDAGRLKGFSIDLKVETDGTTWLMGRVSSEEQQQLALNTAARVKGVTKVVNDLAVEAAPVRQAFTPVAHEIGSGVNPEADPAPARLQPVPGSADAGGSAAATAATAGSGLRPLDAASPPGLRPGPDHRLHRRRADRRRTAPRFQVTGGGAVGMAAARYDHPNMPGYAWPAYASHPNYAAVTYPKQYSPTRGPTSAPSIPIPRFPSAGAGSAWNGMTVGGSWISTPAVTNRVG